jgi:glutamate N-acetyltransferase/amino-acid N-acetyltransferase
MEVEVSGACNRKEAALAAHAVATSPLVKTALYSGDPNWGRILAAVGRSGARISTRKVSLRVGPLILVSNGEPMAYKERDAARHFNRERVSIVVDLGSGNATATLLTSDLGHDYVALNANYRS